MPTANPAANPAATAHCHQHPVVKALLGVLCPAGSLDEAWLSGTPDSRTHKLETVLAILIGRRIFLAAEAAGHSDE